MNAIDATLDATLGAAMDRKLARQADRASAADKYRDLAAQGYSQSTTATILGVTREAVRQMANRHGIHFESGKVDVVLEENVAALHALGFNDTAIGQVIGRDQSAVCRVRKRLGLPAQKRQHTWASYIRECADEGLTLTQTARRLGLTPQNVWTEAHRVGIVFTAKYRRWQQ